MEQEISPRPFYCNYNFTSTLTLIIISHLHGYKLTWDTSRDTCTYKLTFDIWTLVHNFTTNATGMVLESCLKKIIIIWRFCEFCHSLVLYLNDNLRLSILKVLVFIKTLDMNRYVCIKTFLYILPEISAHHLQLKCMGGHFFSVP